MKKLVMTSIIYCWFVFSLFSQNIEGGGGHAILRCIDGSVFTTGYNSEGQLGNDTTTSEFTFKEVLGLSDVIQVGAGTLHTMALDKGGNVWVWGNNNYGQLGDSTYTSRYRPTRMQNLDKVKQIKAGRRFSLYLLEDSTVWGNGENLSGQLGSPSPTSYPYPVKISGLENIVQIASGHNHNMALKAVGTVWTLGFNGYGQLGDGTTNQSAIPVQVQSLQNVVGIAAGWGVSYAIKNDGSLWSWGSNSHGQLGTGVQPGFNPSPMPTLVANIDSVEMIKSNVDFTLALRKDGTVWAWGKNFYGQLGDSTTADKNLPVRVKGLRNIIEIAVGTAFGYAVDNQGQIFSWGAGPEGALASDTIKKKLTPSPITPIACNPVISVPEVKLKKQTVEIYPNPTEGMVAFSSEEIIENVEVFNAAGISLKSIAQPGSQMDISDLPNGIYFLKLEVEGKMLVQKILKQ